MTSKECIQLLRAIVDETPIRIAIDAVDECDDPGKLLNALEALSIKGRVKFLLSGRPDVDITPYFEKTEELYLSSDLCESDMQTFIVQEIKDRKENERILRGRHPKLEDELISVLLDKAGGM